MFARLAVLALLTGCSVQDVKQACGGCGIDITVVPGFGQVFECKADGQTFELCYDGEADALERSLDDNGWTDAVCYDTPRHAGVCWYHCDGGRGCNATSGCWCP